MTETLTGTLKCDRWARTHARGVASLGSLIRDVVAPLPPDEVWSLIVPAEGHPRGKLIYQLKSHRRPKALSDVPEGSEVTVRAGVEMWKNGAGGHLSNVHLIAVSGAPQEGDE